MQNIKKGSSEEKFAEMIWKNEPISSFELANIAFNEMNWKKTTCFTMLKRLENKGLFINDGGVVKSVIGKQEYYSNCARQYVDAYFNKSLVMFISSFVSGRKLNSKEIDELKKLIDDCGENDA